MLATCGLKKCNGQEIGDPQSRRDLFCTESKYLCLSHEKDKKKKRKSPLKGDTFGAIFLHNPLLTNSPTFNVLKRVNGPLVIIDVKKIGVITK